MMRRAIPAFFSLAISCGIAAGQTAPDAPAPPPLAQQVSALLAQPAVARDHWGIQVTTLDGTTLYSLNESQLFQPASNAKLFTTAAAMTLLGPNTRFETTVQITATIGARGVLHGNLELVGGGDANFGARNIPYVRPQDRPKITPPPETSIADIDDLADQVVAKGIRTIEGDILGNDGQIVWNPYPSDWSWDDLLWGYGAPVSALTIHDNQIDVNVAPGSGINAVVSTSPNLPYYAITNWVATQEGEKRDCDAIRYSRGLGSKELHIEGDIPEGAAPCTEHVAILDPAEFAAQALKVALEKRGVHVTGVAKAVHSYINGESDASGYATASDVVKLLASPGSPPPCITITLHGPEPSVIARHTSPTLIEDLVYTNKVSQNLHAELLLRNMGLRTTCTDSVKADLHLERQFLINAGLDPHDFVFFDGSGLSGHDLVTPRATAKLLQYAVTQPWFAAWKASLPIGGEDGTLETRFPKPPLKDHLFAKTGTLGEARALSGYLDAASGRTVIFSIMVGNHLPGDNSDREVMDKIVALIAAAE